MSDLLSDVRASLDAAGHVRACVGCQHKSTPAAPAEPRCQCIASKFYAQHCAGVVNCSQGPRPIRHGKIAP